mgnify:CR=1 FL=1
MMPFILYAATTKMSTVHGYAFWVSFLERYDKYYIHTNTHTNTHHTQMHMQKQGPKKSVVNIRTDVRLFEFNTCYLLAAELTSEKNKYKLIRKKFSFYFRLCRCLKYE